VYNYFAAFLRLREAECFAEHFNLVCREIRLPRLQELDVGFPELVRLFGHQLVKEFSLSPCPLLGWLYRRFIRSGRHRLNGNFRRTRRWNLWLNGSRGRCRLFRGCWAVQCFFVHVSGDLVSDLLIKSILLFEHGS